MSVGDNEMTWRALAHQLRLAKKRGRLREGMEEFAELFEELFRDMADETKACGDNDESAMAMLKEVVSDVDNEDEDDDAN